MAKKTSFSSETANDRNKFEFKNEENNFSTNNAELNDIIVLLKQVINKVNNFDVQYMQTVNRSAELDKKCTTLQLEIDELKNQKCPKCSALKKYKRKAKEVKSRLMSIANILNSESNSNSNSLIDSLNSQLLNNGIEIGKRKHSDEEDDDDSDEPKDINLSECKWYGATNSDPENKGEASPKKSKNNITDDENCSPVIHSYDLKRIKSRRLNDLSSSGDHGFERSKEDQISPAPTNSSGNSKTDHKFDSKRNDNGNVETVNEKKTWSLKKSHQILPPNNGKLKQMTLSVMVAKEQDISKIPEFNGGIAQSKTDCGVNEVTFMPDASSTIVEEIGKVKTPKEINEEGVDKNQGKSEDKFPAEGIVNENPPEEKKIVMRKKLYKPESPSYKYRRDALKNRVERKKLPGQACQECNSFYEKLDMSDSQRKKMMDRCSRHRDKYPIQIFTPPGFWNPRFDDSD